MRIDIGEAIVIAGPCSRGVVRLQERSLHEGGGRRGTGGRTHTVTRTGRSVIARGMSLSLAAQELAVAQKVAASGLSARARRGRAVGVVHHTRDDRQKSVRGTVQFMCYIIRNIKPTIDRERRTAAQHTLDRLPERNPDLQSGQTQTRTTLEAAQ